MDEEISRVVTIESLATEMAAALYKYLAMKSFDFAHIINHLDEFTKNLSMYEVVAIKAIGEIPKGNFEQIRFLFEVAVGMDGGNTK